MSESDALDVPLLDRELLAEVHLTTDLIIAAQTYDRPLSTAEIDRLLQLDPDPVDDPASPLPAGLAARTRAAGRSGGVPGQPR